MTLFLIEVIRIYLIIYFNSVSVDVVTSTAVSATISITGSTDSSTHPDVSGEKDEDKGTSNKTGAYSVICRGCKTS